MNPYYLALVAGGFTIVGILGAPLLNNYFTAKRNAMEKFNIAAQAFTAALSDELNILKSSDRGNPFMLLHAARQKHLTAMTAFRKVIPEKRLSPFDSAWKTYYENHKQYSTRVDQSQGLTNRQRRQLAIDRIEALLKFTEK